MFKLFLVLLVSFSLKILQLAVYSAQENDMFSLNIHICRAMNIDVQKIFRLSRINLNTLNKFIPLILFKQNLLNPFDNHHSPSQMLSKARNIQQETAYTEVVNPLTGTAHLIGINSLESDDSTFSNNQELIFHAINLLTTATIKLGSQKRNQGTKRDADGHKKKYINREVKKILQPRATALSEHLDFDFDVVLFQLVGVEPSTLRTYKTTIGNFNRFILNHQKLVLIPDSFRSKHHLLTFFRIISSILTAREVHLQTIMHHYLIWGTTIKAQNSIKNMSSGVIFYGELFTDGLIRYFPRPKKKFLRRAVKLAKNGTGGAIPFENEDLPLAFIEWLILQNNSKDQWSGCFYALMFFGTLRPTITYTISPTDFTYSNKYGYVTDNPTTDTVKVILNVYRFKNQVNHVTPKPIPLDWNRYQKGPTPTNVVQTFRQLFHTHKQSPKFAASSKLMQAQLRRFKKAKHLSFVMKAYTAESFRESMMGLLAREGLRPYEMTYVTHHRSERSIKYVYLAKQKKATFKKYNNILNSLFHN